MVFLPFFLEPKRPKINKVITNRKPPIAPLTGRQGLIFEPLGKAEIYADILQEQFSCPNGCPITGIIVEQSIQSLTVESEAHTHPITPGEIKTIIKHLPRRKAPGPDGIPNTALKKLPDKAIIYITKIFNYYIRFNYSPKYSNQLQ